MIQHLPSWLRLRAPRRRAPHARRAGSRLKFELLEARALLDGSGVAPVAACAQLPLSFEINQGQADSAVNFLAHGSGYGLYLTPNEAVLSLRNPPATSPLTSQPSPPTELRMQFISANPSAPAVGVDELAAVTNYLIGDDPTKWRTGVANYGQVDYQDLYAGIDLTYYGDQRRLEYDFTVAPGADPSRIAFQFAGAQSVSLDSQGNLVLHTAGGDVVEHAPVVYQTIDGVRQAVDGRYLVADDGRVGFGVGAYDRNEPLVIDPVLSYSTYLGGMADDSANAIAVDSAGNAYVAGTTSSADFPIVNGVLGYDGGSDTFVTKLSAGGLAVAYSTYLGGSGTDESAGIAVDSGGNAYVTGSTTSSDFPTTSEAVQRSSAGLSEAYVAKLNATGSAFVYSTYMGGGKDDDANGIAVDAAGDASVSGFTNSSTFPTFNAYQPVFHGTADAFVAKLNPAGSAFLFSTFLGGTGFSVANGVAVDPTGTYVTGQTSSTDFPTTPGAYQTFLPGQNNAFVSKLDTAGSLVYSTYLGGEATDEGNGIAVFDGRAYVTGTTDSFFFPTSDLEPQGTLKGGFDAFVTAFDPAGKFEFSTYLGGSGYDNAIGIATSVSGRVYVTGYTMSSDFPQVDAVRPPGGGGALDAFIAEIDLILGRVLFSTYLGGSGKDYASAVAVDSFDSAYVAGTTGSTDLPTNNALQPLSGGGSDAFVAKIAATPLQLAGTPFTLPGLATVTVANLADNRGPSAADDFNATIDWGDGQTTSGTVVGSSGMFTVQGQHEYAAANNSFSVVVTVQDKEGDKVKVQTDGIGGPPPTPSASNDSFVISRAASSAGSGATSVLANDTSADGRPDELRATLLNTTAHGSLSLSGAGSFSYSPDPSFQGLDRFQYSASELGSGNSLATVTLMSPEASIVDKLYHQVLGRSAEDSGLQFWTAKIMGGASYSAVAEGIFESDERLNAIIAGGQLGSISYPGYYPQFLLRPAEPDGLAYWKSIWKRDGGPDNVISGMISSPEFFASAGLAHPSLSANAAWVTSLYERLLSREPEASGLQYWTGHLDDGSMTRQVVVLGFVQSDENFRILTSAFFQQYLSRPPTSAELAQYVAQFKAGGSQRVVQEAIINTLEYKNTPPAPVDGTVGEPLYPRV